MIKQTSTFLSALKNLMTGASEFSLRDYQLKSALKSLWLPDYFQPIERGEIPTGWLYEFSRGKLQDKYMWNISLAQQIVTDHFITHTVKEDFYFSELLRIGGKTIGTGNSIEECVSKYINCHGFYSQFQGKELWSEVVKHLESAVRRSSTHLSSYSWEAGPCWDAIDGNHAAGIGATTAKHGLDPVIMNLNHTMTTISSDIHQGRLFIVKSPKSLLCGLTQVSHRGHLRLEFSDFGLYEIELDAPTVSTPGLPYSCLLVDTKAELSEFSIKLMRKAVVEGLAVDLITELRKVEKSSVEEKERMLKGRISGWDSELPTQMNSTCLPL